MEWKRFTIHTTEEAEEPVTALLAELGIEAVEVTDKRPFSAEESGGLYGDVVPEMPEDDHLAELSFYMEKDADCDSLLKELRSRLEALRNTMDIGSGRIEESVTREEDWINNWKDYFHSFRVDDILIRPSWESDKTEAGDASMVLEIDPGTAFGTGAHESTQLAIRALRKYLKSGDSFLDIGTGSGILGIIALKSGASEVFGTDLDPNTLPAIEENLEANGLSDSNFVRVLGKHYDVVAANIIAEILSEITPQVPAHLKEGGYYITSGILEGHEDIVIDAAEKAGLRVTEINRLGEWMSIVFRK